MPKDKLKNDNNLQNTTQKTKDQATLKTWGEPRCSESVNSSCATSGTQRVTLVRNPVISHERIGKCLRQQEHIRGHL
jgi:hypothetical protein